MADALIERPPCGCCLRTPRDPGSPDGQFVNKETYWTMLKECFNIQVTGACKECGICQKCVDRLQDAKEFKLQVQHSQAALQARLRALPDMHEEPEVKTEAEDGTNNTSHIPELLKVVVLIKEEPPEEASPMFEELTGPEDPRPAEGSSSGSEDLASAGAEPQQSGEHFLLGVDRASPSTSGDQRDATPTPTSEPDTEHTAYKKHPCNICGKHFAFIGSLRRHIKLHTGEKSYACDVCKKTFSQSCHLREHKLIHTGVKPYSCEICEKNFTLRNTLTQHLRTHADIRVPFPCSICNKSFMRIGALKTHKRIHSGEKPYVCEICNKAFTLPEGLRRHTYTHTDKKPFECTICHKKFADTGDLKRHIRVHTGEKPFSCEDCGKKFAQLSNLKQHKRIHSGYKPHVCEVCQRRFAKSSHLKVHKKLHMES